MATKNLPSTQSHLDIDDIQQDLVVLKNGNIALVLETGSLNFELFSDEEQDARIQSFSNLINAINFPMQIVIRTERTDLNDYIEKLVQMRQRHISKGLRKQMEIYIKFINNLLTKTDVLNKRFLIVLRTNFTVKTTSSNGIIPGFGGKTEVKHEIDLARATEYLYPKRNFLIKELRKMGIKSVQLNKAQLIQLYYDIYDPDKVGANKIDLNLDEADAQKQKVNQSQNIKQQILDN